MSGLIQINRHRVFTHEEAEGVLPVIYRMTEEISREVKHLFQCVEALPDKKSARALELEATLDGMIDRWQQKVQRLGAKPKGLWLADFDSGDGYWCWKFPETQIRYKHGYQDGFSGRKLIEETHGNHPS